MLKTFVGDWEFAGINAEILHQLLLKARRPFTIEPLHQGHAFVTCNVTGSDLLCGVVGCTPDAEFYKRRPIMQIIDLIIDLIVLAVSPWCPMWARLEAAMLNGIIVAALRMPFQVIAKIMNFDALEQIRIGGKVGNKIILC